MCRSNKEFALKCYKALSNPNARKLFVLMYGLPPGAEERPRLRLVTDLQSEAAEECVMSVMGA